MLRIGIDAHVLTGKPQGSRPRLVNIIGRAAARHPDATYVVYSGDPEACARIVSGDN
ncbi:glycosyl transferase family 1, partial [Methylobacterium radiotolerans]